MSTAAVATRIPIHEHDRLAGELVRAYRAGDPGALERLLKANERLVFTVVKRKLRGHGRTLDDPSFEDLMQAGRLGVIKSAEKYDPERASWGTFATWWIRHAVQREFESDTIVTVPNNWHAVTYKEDLARAIGCRAGSAPLGADGEELTIDQSVEARGDHIAEADLVDEAETWRDRVRVCLRRLPERYADVLRRRYGLDGEPETLLQVGRSLGVTRECIRQTEERAERKLRIELKRAYGDLLPADSATPGPRLYVSDRLEPPPAAATDDQVEVGQRQQVLLAREERERLRAERIRAQREIQIGTKGGAMGESNGKAAAVATPGRCGKCNGRLSGPGRGRCQCGKSAPAARPLLAAMTTTPATDPRPALAAALASVDEEPQASADFELEAMGKVLKALRKLSPAGRRWVLENVQKA